MINRKHLSVPTTFFATMVLIVGIGAWQGLLFAHGSGPLRVRVEISFSTATTGIAWSKNGASLAVYSDAGKRISVWNAKGERLAEMSRDVPSPWYGNSIDFLSSDDVLTPPDRYSEEYKHYTLSVWDIKRGAVVRHIDGRSLSTGSNWAYAFAVSNNKKTAAIITHGGNEIIAYDANTWRMISTPALYPDNAISVALSPDGGLTALGTAGGQLAVFDTKTGNRIRTIDAYPGLGMAVTSLAFSPDGSQIATGSGLTINGSQNDTPVRIWSVFDGALLRVIHENGLQPIRSITWNVPGDSIAFAARDEVRVWNQRDGRIVVQNLDSNVMVVAFSPDGASLAVCAGDKAVIFDINRPDR